MTMKKYEKQNGGRIYRLNNDIAKLREYTLRITLLTYNKVIQ